MTTYLFTDGPLAGQVIGSAETHSRGDRMDVGVSDVCQAADDDPTFAYAVTAEASSGRSGTLSYLGGART
jgi:hypothetical protein